MDQSRSQEGECGCIMRWDSRDRSGRLAHAAGRGPRDHRMRSPDQTRRDDDALRRAGPFVPGGHGPAGLRGKCRRIPEPWRRPAARRARGDFSRRDRADAARAHRAGPSAPTVRMARARALAVRGRRRVELDRPSRQRDRGRFPQRRHRAGPHGRVQRRRRRNHAGRRIVHLRRVRRNPRRRQPTAPAGRRVRPLRKKPTARTRVPAYISSRARLGHCASMVSRGLTDADARFVSAPPESVAGRTDVQLLEYGYKFARPVEGRAPEGSSCPS